MKKYPKGSIGWHIELAEKIGYPDIEELKKTLAINKFKIWAQGKGVFKSDMQVSKDEYNATIKKFGFSDDKEYREDLAERREFNNHSSYQKFLYQKRGGIQYLENLAKRRGYESRDVLLNNLAKKAGYTNNKDRSKEWYRDNRDNKGINFSLNENCPQYLGVEIGEKKIARKILPLIIGEIMEEMPIGNSGFDFICKNEKLKDRSSQDILKIDVKSAMLIDDKYRFKISFNCFTDYFLVIAFNGNNRAELSPTHVLLFGKDDMVRKKMARNSYEMKTFHDREGISISNNHDSVMYLGHFIKYEKTDMIIEKFRDLNKLMEE